MPINFGRNLIEVNFAIPKDGYAQAPDNTSLSYELTNYSSASSFVSSPAFIGKWNGYSMTLALSGVSYSGTIKLQGCNDRERLTGEPDSTSLVNWFDITGATSAVSNGAPDILTIDHCDARYRWVRFSYTATSGTITVSARLQLKG